MFILRPLSRPLVLKATGATPSKACFMLSGYSYSVLFVCVCLSANEIQDLFV